MNNKNVILNCTLENYNKKYRNRRYRLIKYTKKEVEDFDKQYGHYIFNKKTYSLEFNNYLLKDRKWVLINGTYYEIPRPIRFTWFRNLNAGIQTITCLIGVGAVSSAIVVPTLMLTIWNKGDKPIGPEPVKEWYEDQTYLNGLKEEDVTKGTVKEITVNGLAHKVRLIGIEHDDLADGSGKAHTTWEFANLISDKDGNSLAYLWNDIDNTTYLANCDYENSSIRYALTGKGKNNNLGEQILTAQNRDTNWNSSYKNKKIIDMLPTGLVNKLKIVKKSVAKGYPYVEGIYEEQLFLLSQKEIGGTGTPDFGSTYKYYDGATEDTKRIKKQVSLTIKTGTSTILRQSGHQRANNPVKNYAGQNYSATYGGRYWLRSPLGTTDGYSYNCNSSGDFIKNDYVCATACAVAPAFCL